MTNRDGTMVKPRPPASLLLPCHVLNRFTAFEFFRNRIIAVHGVTGGLWKVGIKLRNLSRSNEFQGRVKKGKVRITSSPRVRPELTRVSNSNKKEAL